MKHVLITLFAILLGCGILLAQETAPPPGTGSAQQPVPPAGQASPTATPATGQPATQAGAQSSGAAPEANKSQIAPGSVIPVQLAKTVDAKKAKKGDEVVAKVTQDLQATSGKVIVPKDTKVIGHVTEAQARSKEQKESQLAITFDRVDIKGGEQMQLPMSIQAIIAPPNRNAGNENSGNPSEQAQSGAGNTGAGASSGGYGGRGAMGGNTGSPSSQPNGSGSAANAPSDAKNSGTAQPQITGETRGVVGIANLTLSAAPDASQGSLVTSEKNNVKLEDGTFLLLRVSPQGMANPAATQSPQR